MPVFDKQTSKIKMVILTKGEFDNVVWYSPINQNRRRSDLIIRSMMRRLRANKLFEITVAVQFYENSVLIAQYKK